MSDRVERRLAAILAADVAGYSRLMGADEEGTLERLKALRRELLDPKITEHHGRIVKTTGDGLLVEFASVVDAVRCAVEVQQAMPERHTSVAVDDRIELRVGINLGDVIVEGDDLYGDGVNIAARIEALADAGGVFVSNTVHDHVRDRLPFVFEDLGEQQVKNIARPVRVYRVGLWSVAPTPTTSSPASRGGSGRGQAGEGRLAALPLPDKPSIAVLPFANMSGDLEQEYFADGVVEEIITALSRIRWLFVIARNSSFTYKGEAVDVKRVGRELGVRYVLEGSVRRGGNRVRVTAQLIDAFTGAHIWAERYDRDLTDIFAVQDEITASVAGIIEPALVAAEQERVLRKPPDRLDAWEAYQRGMWHFNKYGAEANKIAQDFFRQAIALDSDFAPGHHGLAFALFFEFWLYSARSTEALDVARAEARLAVTLDDRDAIAHSVLASLTQGLSGDWGSSIAEALAALALNPNSASVLAILGGTLMTGGNAREGIDRLRQALRASPNDPLAWLWLYMVGCCQFQLRDFEAALQTHHEVRRLRAQHAMAHLYIAASLAYLGRRDEARQAFELVTTRFSDTLARNNICPPWWRPENHAQLIEGLRLAASGET
jgi:adenylate cyclase